MISEIIIIVKRRVYTRLALEQSGWRRRTLFETCAHLNSRPGSELCRDKACLRHREREHVLVNCYVNDGRGIPPLKVGKRFRPDSL